MIGETVGNYRITKLLGEGGMGAVYVAEHPTIGRRAAVKILHAELAKNVEMITRFFNEARAANAIRHPGIVEVFDSGTLASSGAPYIVMELLEGESLASRMRRASRIAPDVARELGGQAAHALAAAHAAGIVHRDLKPDNLFLTPDYRNHGAEVVKILDFGIAKLATDALGASSVKTRTGAIMGTPIYMSPEQCLANRELDRRTDVYALGVILYEMVCGEPPFRSESFVELANLHINARPRPPRAHDPAIPEDLEAAILKSLAKQPEHRFQSMDELGQALAGRRGAGAAPARPPEAAAPGAPVTRTRRLGDPEEIPPATRVAAAAITTLSHATGSAHARPRSRRSPLTLAFVGGGAAVLVAALALSTGVLSRGEPEAEVEGAAPAPRPGARAAAPAPQRIAPAPGGGAGGAGPAAPPPPRPGAVAAAAAPKRIAPAPVAGAGTAPSLAAAQEPAAGTRAAEAARAGDKGARIKVAIASQPAAARVVREADGTVVGVTPLVETWSRGEGVEKLRLEKDGYLPQPVAVSLRANAELAIVLKKDVPPAARKKRPGVTAPTSPPAPRPERASPLAEPEPDPI